MADTFRTGTVERCEKCDEVISQVTICPECGKKLCVICYPTHVCGEK